MVIVVVYALGSGRWVSTGSTFYRSLARPSWQPPDAVFGLIWPYNFVVLIVAGMLVAARASAGERVAWVAFLGVGVIFALGWAWLFYVSESLWPAAGSLALAALAAWPLVVIGWRVSPALGAAVAPYAMWVSIATSLAVGYARLNPR